MITVCIRQKNKGGKEYEFLDNVEGFTRVPQVGEHIFMGNNQTLLEVVHVIHQPTSTTKAEIYVQQTDIGYFV